jgi:hypothetical protein
LEQRFPQSLHHSVLSLCITQTVLIREQEPFSSNPLKDPSLISEITVFRCSSETSGKKSRGVVFQENKRHSLYLLCKLLELLHDSETSSDGQVADQFHELTLLAKEKGRPPDDDAGIAP